MKLLTLILMLIVSSQATAQTTGREKPVSLKKEFLVYTPKWENIKRIPLFVQNKIEKKLMESDTKFGWEPKQVGLLQYSMRSFLKKVENTYFFQLKIYTLSGVEIATETGRCEICTITETVDSISEYREKLLAKLENHYNLNMKAYIDAEKKQKAKELARKEETDRKRREYEKKLKEASIPLIKGEIQSPDNLKFPAWNHPPPPFKLWFWSTSVLGTAALITGVTLLAIDNGATCSADYTQRCPERYATGAAGAGFLITGAALGGVATWLFFKITEKGDTPFSIVPSVSKDNAGINFGFSF
ncbi:MAG: hypothetical protein JXR95_14335 [Deltaproteobacteria bacterium]|nr:hypothetical protein [Deltaproteobacteria bacterium]